MVALGQTDPVLEQSQDLVLANNARGDQVNAETSKEFYNVRRVKVAEITRRIEKMGRVHPYRMHAVGGEVAKIEAQRLHIGE